MNCLLALSKSPRGAAAVEMALVTPLLLIILMGSFELGNYFRDEHILVKAVRDGARYAARQSFSNYSGCAATAVNAPSVLANTKLIVRKGSLNSSAPDILPNWTSNDTNFLVQMSCSTSAGSTTLSGIYVGNSTGTVGVAPVVSVTAKLPYRPILASFGFTGTGYYLNATQQAAVMGI